MSKAFIDMLVPLTATGLNVHASGGASGQLVTIKQRASLSF